MGERGERGPAIANVWFSLRYRPGHARVTISTRRNTGSRIRRMAAATAYALTIQGSVQALLQRDCANVSNFAGRRSRRGRRREDAAWLSYMLCCAVRATSDTTSSDVGRIDQERREKQVRRESRVVIWMRCKLELRDADSKHWIGPRSLVSCCSTRAPVPEKGCVSCCGHTARDLHYQSA